MFSLLGVFAFLLFLVFAFLFDSLPFLPHYGDGLSKNKERIIGPEVHALEGVGRKKGKPKGRRTAVQAGLSDLRDQLEMPVSFPPLKVKVLVNGNEGNCPLGGAKVYLFDIAAMKGEDGAFRDKVFAEIPGFLYAPGQLGDYSDVFETDSSGVVYIPVKYSGPWIGRDEGALIWAESKDRREASLVFHVGRDREGMFWERSPETKGPLKDGLEILLAPVTILRVQVRNQKGKAVPMVPLGLFYSVTGPDGGRSLILKTRTDSRGVGRFRAVKKVVEELKPLTCYYVSFLFPHPDLKSHSVRLEESNLLGRPVQLIIPPTGSISVNVEGWEKGGPGEQAWVSLLDQERKRKDYWGEKSTWFKRRERILNYSLPVKGGKAFFPYVGLGMNLSLRCVRQGVWKISGREVQGPGGAGEKVFVSIPLPGKDPSLAMELVDRRGQPLPGLFVGVGLPGYYGTDLRLHPDVCFYMETVISGEDGRILIPLPPAFSKGKIGQMKLVSRSGPGGGKRRVCILDLPPPFSGGCKDLGKVVLGSPPLLVSGRVLDYWGKPLDGATVTLRRAIIRGKKEAWISVVSCKSRRDGSFSLEGFWPWKEMKVGAAKRFEGVSISRVVPPGSRGVELVLTGAGSVEGRLLVDRFEDLERRRISLLFKKLGSKPVGGFSGIGKRVGKDGRIVWKGLPPGTYTFFVRVNGEPGVDYCVVEGVRVRPGERTEDPRMLAIDTRGLFEEADLEIRGKGGKILKGAFINGSYTHTYPPDHFFRLLVGKGRRPMCLVKVHGYKKDEIRLEPGRKVVIFLEKEPPSKKNPFLGQEGNSF